MTARAEKTIRLVLVCSLASVFGITAVAIESETLGYVAAGIVLAGIMVGPLVARVVVGRSEAPGSDRR